MRILMAFRFTKLAQRGALMLVRAALDDVLCGNCSDRDIRGSLAKW